MNATSNDAITIVKRNKIVDLYYELVKAKIHLLIQTRTQEERDKIEKGILMIITKLEEV